MSLTRRLTVRVRLVLTVSLTRGLTVRVRLVRLVLTVSLISRLGLG